jgi:hypothetical protein
MILYDKGFSNSIAQYKTFAASVMAAAGTSRSIFGAILPFAAKPMYDKLGVPWACSLLGFLSLVMAVIPWIFLWKGESLRARSKFCQYLIQKEKEEEEVREQRHLRDGEIENGNDNATRDVESLRVN